MVNIEEKTLSNAGKTILNMTKANYDVALFMGRLDKRMGDVHYLNKMMMVYGLDFVMIELKKI